MQRIADIENPVKVLRNYEGLLCPRQWPKAALRREKILRSRLGSGSPRERANWVRHVNDGDKVTKQIVVEDKRAANYFYALHFDRYCTDICDAFQPRHGT